MINLSVQVFLTLSNDTLPRFRVKWNLRKFYNTYLLTIHYRHVKIQKYKIKCWNWGSFCKIILSHVLRSINQLYSLLAIQSSLNFIHSCVIFQKLLQNKQVIWCIIYQENLKWMLPWALSNYYLLTFISLRFYRNIWICCKTLTGSYIPEKELLFFLYLFFNFVRLFILMLISFRISLLYQILKFQISRTRRLRTGNFSLRRFLSFRFLVIYQADFLWLKLKCLMQDIFSPKVALYIHRAFLIFRDQSLDVFNYGHFKQASIILLVVHS